MPTPRKRRRLAKAAVSLTVLALAAAAYAYWSASGSGAGTATTADPGAQSVVVNQTSAASGLYPGSSVALSGDFDNAATNAVHVNAVTASVTGTDKPGCAAGNYSISGVSTIAGGGMVPSGNGTGGWSGLTLSMVDDPVNDQEACKGATVSISYSAS